MTLEEKIKDIEEEISNTPYNKATQHHIGKLKAKLAQLREQAVKKASAGRGGGGFGVKKSGHATVVLIGFPSVGKSTLLNKLTSAKSAIGDYEFTTLEVVPGIMEHRDTKIQILDIPGIITGASSGKGRGREILSIARTADLIVILLDIFQPQQLDVIRRELYNAGIRLNQHPPNADIKKTSRGGVTLLASPGLELTKVDEKMAREILNMYGIHNADVTIREDISPEQLIDSIVENRAYIPAVVIVNKIDMAEEDYGEFIKSEIKEDFIPISADKGSNIDLLKDKIFEKLDVIRVYMKPQGKKADMEEPLIIRRGSNVGDVCDLLHGAFREKFRYAKIWGKSVKFPGQKKGLSHVFADKDILMLVKEK